MSQLLYFDQLVTFVPPNHACSIGAASAFADERLSTSFDAAHVMCRVEHALRMRSVVRHLYDG